jgi:putative ABC transport system ATP-binding protein
MGDEPTGNLDSAASRDVLALLGAARRRGQTLMIVTHDARVAAAADRVVTMRDGEIVSGVDLVAARPVSVPFDPPVLP